MKRIFTGGVVLLSGVSTLLASTSAVAGPPGQGTVAPATTPVQAAERYLKEGRQYLRAIRLLSTATAAKPDAATYRMLGMAYASRFASVAYARHQAEAYPDAKRDWDKRRALRDKADAESVPDAVDFWVPPAPLPPTTPDDDKPFTLSDAQSRAAMITLGNQCLAAFDKARACADTTEETAATLYERGWCLLLFQNLGQDVVTQKASAKTGESQKLPRLEIAEQDAADCFTVCVKTVSASADYWHALALARLPRRLMPAAFGEYQLADLSENDTSSDLKSASRLQQDAQASADTSDAAWAMACSLRPKDWELMYQRALYRLSDDPAGAVALLEQTTQRNANNAALWYLLADARLRLPQASDSPAAGPSVLQAIESGNQAPAFTSLPFRLPLPAALRAAWGYEPLYGYNDEERILIGLGTFLSQRWDSALRAGQEDTALRAARAQMDLGIQTTLTLTAQNFLQASDAQKQRFRVRGVMGAISGIQRFQDVRREQEAHPSPAKQDFIIHYEDTCKRLLSTRKAIAN